MIYFKKFNINNSGFDRIRVDWFGGFGMLYIEKYKPSWKKYQRLLEVPIENLEVYDDYLYVDTRHIQIRVFDKYLVYINRVMGEMYEITKIS